MGAAAGALGGFYQAVASELAAKKQRRQMQPLINQQTDLATTQADMARTLAPYVGQYYQKAGEAFDPAVAHYLALAGGDRSKLMSAVAPQLADTGAKYSSIMSATRELAPRSGAGAAFNNELAYRAGDDQQRIIESERAAAYPNLAKMAGLAGDLGAGAAGNSTRAGEGASGMLTTAMSSGRQLASDQAAAYAQIAKGLWDAYTQYRGRSSAGTGSSNGKWGGGTSSGNSTGIVDDANYLPAGD